MFSPTITPARPVFSVVQQPRHQKTAPAPLLSITFGKKEDGPLTVGIVTGYSGSKTSYELKRFKVAAQKRGLKVKFIRYRKPFVTYLSNLRKKNRTYNSTKRLGAADIIIPRITGQHSGPGLVLLGHLEEVMGRYSVNSYDSVSRAADKIRTHQLLVKHDVPTVDTVYANSLACSPRRGDLLVSLLKRFKIADAFVKLLAGSGGTGVEYGRTPKNTAQLTRSLSNRHGILVQPPIKNSIGRDERYFVVGDNVVAAMERRGADGSAKSNASAGGKGHPIDIDEKTARIAVEATKALGLKVAGVDILQSKTGPLVLEVNASPGFKALQTTTETDIAQSVIDFALEDYKAQQTTLAFA